MKDILMVTHFTQVPGEAGNGRFNYIANMLSKDPNKKVEVVTSSFSHGSKKQRKLLSENLNDINYKLTMIKEPNYKKNVSLRRFYSHFIIGRNLKKYLKRRTKPDIIYCSVPSLDVAKTAAKYAKKNNIKFIIDVQDIWPEAFKLIFNLPIISNLIFYPMKRSSEYIYKSADEIISVSKTYSDLAHKYNKKCNRVYDVFLGTELKTFDDYKNKNMITNKPSNEVWIAYAGTLGHSYDLTAVIESLTIMKNKGFKNFKFIIMGNGPLKHKFEKHIEKNQIPANFTGRLNYDKMVGLLSACDIAVNPISKGAAQSIINKHADYAAAGLPVVNTQESKEYRELVDEHKIGFNCKNNNAKDLADKLLQLYENKTLRIEMGSNHRKLAETRFDRTYTYPSIIDVINKNLN